MGAHEYLSRHFDHGATLMIVNEGADGELGGVLSKQAWSDDAVREYQRFLDGG